jgi:hypothetical protein
MTIEILPIPTRKINGFTIGGEQTVVSHDGSVGVYTFDIASTEGTAWLLFQDHSGTNDGEPGRPIPSELMGERKLDETPGVLFGFKDPRSIDVIVEALVKLRRELMIHQGWDMIACTPPKEPRDKDTPPSPAIVNTGNC